MSNTYLRNVRVWEEETIKNLHLTDRASFYRIDNTGYPNMKPVVCPGIVS
jgi:hypothetical protein